MHNYGKFEEDLVKIIDSHCLNFLHNIICKLFALCMVHGAWHVNFDNKAVPVISENSFFH